MSLTHGPLMLVNLAGASRQPSTAAGLAEAIYLSKFPYPDGTLPPEPQPAATPSARNSRPPPPHCHVFAVSASLPSRAPVPWPIASQTKAGLVAAGAYAPGGPATPNLPDAHAEAPVPGLADHIDLCLALPAHGARRTGGVSGFLGGRGAASRSWKSLFGIREELPYKQCVLLHCGKCPCSRQP